MKLKDKIIREVIEITRTSLGLTGVILFASGLTIAVTCLTGSVIEKTAKIIKPYQDNLQPWIQYGTASAFLGVIVGSTGFLLNKWTEEYLADIEWAEKWEILIVPPREFQPYIKADRRPEQCKGCIFYSDDDEYLRCAVNPELTPDCPHFRKELKAL